MRTAIRVETELPAEITRLLRIARAERFDFVERLVREWKRGENRFAETGEMFLCSYVDDALVGFGGLNRDPYSRNPQEGRIRHVYFAPEARGRGLGGALVRELIRRAPPAFTRLRLASEQAAPFYEHLGFLPTSEPKATHALELGGPGEQASDGAPAWGAAAQRRILRTAGDSVVSLARVIEPGQPIRELEAGLFSVLDAGDEGAPYDSRAAGYDRLVSSRWYSQLAWGVPPIVHTEFITRGLTSHDEGWIVDVAAGSCVPSAPAYARTSRPLVVLDRSLAMLRRGIARLRLLHGELPPHVVFLQADANALPFRADSIATVICHGALHVFSTPEAVCAEWLRVLRAGGELYASSLVRGRWFGDRYLGLLHRAGEIAPPRTASELASLVEAGFGVSGQLETLGNFAYLSLRKSDTNGRLEPPSAARRGS